MAILHLPVFKLQSGGWARTTDLLQPNGCRCSIHLSYYQTLVSAAAEFLNIDGGGCARCRAARRNAHHKLWKHGDGRRIRRRVAGVQESGAEVGQRHAGRLRLVDIKFDVAGESAADGIEDEARVDPECCGRAVL